MRRVLLALAPLLATVAAAASDTETFPCETTDGWSLLDLSGQPPMGASLSAAEGEVRVLYERSTLVLMQHTALMTDLEGLTLTLRSEVASTILVTVVDADGARFQHAFDLAASERSCVSVLPSEFRLADDSPVKKDSLDPGLLRAGYVLADLGAAFGAKGPNTLSVEEVLVRRTDLPVHRGDLVVEGSMEVKEPLFVEGSVVVRTRACLEIVARRFAVGAKVTVEKGGRLEVLGGAFETRGRFAYESIIAAMPGAVVTFRDALFNPSAATGAYVGDGACFTVERTHFLRGLTWDARPAGKTVLRESLTPGEFVAGSQASLSISDSAGILIWLSLGDDAEGQVAFPSGDRIESWEPGLGFHVCLERCGAVVWGVISCPGCRVDVTGSRLIAVGASFEGDTEATISGLRNGAEMEDALFPAGDRRVRFVKSSVQAWNLYAHGTARLTIDHCVFGECGSGDDALLRVIDSTCDGSGGFIGAGDRSRMEIEHSRITTLVSASGASTIVLTDCEIVGEITASEDATIFLVRCTVEGPVREIGNGKVIRK